MPRQWHKHLVFQPGVLSVVLRQVGHCRAVHSRRSIGGSRLAGPVISGAMPEP